EGDAEQGARASLQHVVFENGIADFQYGWRSIAARHGGAALQCCDLPDRVLRRPAVAGLGWIRQGLCTRRERRCSHAAEERDELSPPHLCIGSRMESSRPGRILKPATPGSRHTRIPGPGFNRFSVGRRRHAYFSSYSTNSILVVPMLRIARVVPGSFQKN